MKKILLWMLPLLTLVPSGYLAWHYYDVLADYPGNKVYIAVVVICAVSATLSLLSVIFGLSGTGGTAATVIRILTTVFFLPVAGICIILLMHTIGIVEFAPPPQR